MRYARSGRPANKLPACRSRCIKEPPQSSTEPGRSARRSLQKKGGGLMRSPPWTLIRFAVLLTLLLFLPRTAKTQVPAIQPLRGYAEIHNHQFSYLAFGGRLIVGQAYGPIE